MKISRIAASIAEGTLDLLFAIAITVIVSGHRWLDITLWAIALIGLAGAIWLMSRRRRLGRISE